MNQFKHANWWRSYLGELSKDFGQLQAWISSGNTSTSNGEEENRVKKTAAVFFRTFEALPEVHFLHSIYHFKAQEVKNLTLQTVYDLELKWGRYGLRKTTASCQMTNFARRFSSWCEILPFRTMKTHLAKISQEVDLGTLRNSFESPVLRRCWCYSTAGSPRYFAWFLAL